MKKNLSPKQRLAQRGQKKPAAKNITTPKQTELLRPGSNAEFVLRAHDTPDSKPEVDIVIECSVCGERHYLAKVSSGYELNVYCSNCRSRKAFTIVPRENWDRFAWDRKGERNVRSSKPVESSEPREQKPLVRSGEDQRPRVDYQIPEGRSDNGKSS